MTGQAPKQDGLEKEMYEKVFEEVPVELTYEEKREWLNKLEDVAVSSDAFVSLCPPLRTLS